VGTESLIQQRIALERSRLIAASMVVGGALLVIATGASIVLRSTAAVPQWFALVAWAAVVIAGIVRLVTVRRRRIAFEAEHGADAGIQRRLR